MFPAGIEYHEVQVDSAVVESADALDIDNERSVANLRELLRNAPAIVERETSFLRANEAVAIAADVPFLAGRIARASGLPAVAMGNFLWDWIFEESAGPELLGAIRHGYRGFAMGLRFPFSHREGWEVFPGVSDVTLVTPRSRRPRDDIRRELGIAHDPRPTVLVGGRGRLGNEAVDRIRRDCGDFLFLTPDMHQSFSDLLRAADVVVSKIGYSIAAECIAEGKRLLFPPRDGFREEGVLLPQAQPYLVARPIPRSDWSRGDWKEHLHAILQAAAPSESLPTDGAEQCASLLLTVISDLGRRIRA